MKKKFLTFVLAICLIIPCILGLSACGKKKPDAVVGTYKMTSMTAGTTTMNRENYLTAKNKAEALGGTEKLSQDELMLLSVFADVDRTTIELKKDKTAVMSFPGEGDKIETQNGTWSREGNVVTLANPTGEQIEGPESYTFTFDEKTKTLTVSQEGQAMVYTNVNHIVDPTPAKDEQVVGKYAGTSFSILTPTYTINCSKENYLKLQEKKQQGALTDPLEQQMDNYGVLCYPAVAEYKIENGNRLVIITITRNPSEDPIVINGTWKLVGNIVAATLTGEDAEHMHITTMVVEFDANTNTATYAEQAGPDSTLKMVYSKVAA